MAKNSVVKKKSGSGRTKVGSRRSLPPQRTRSINIFVSYASEDKELVASIVSLLNETFQFAPLSIHRDVEIKQGKNYAKVIDDSLNEADILLVIFTERMKASHSYTGYEVGYFNRSIQQHPTGGADFERIYIPFCIGADIPDSMHYIQGVSVGANDVYRVLRTRLDGEEEPTLDVDHPIFRLLTRISGLISQIVRSEVNDFDLSSHASRLVKPAATLYRIVHEYLQSRISSETYPERKLIIRTPTRPEARKSGVDLDLTAATVEMVGDFFDIFSISWTQSVGRQYSWAGFCDRIPEALRANAIVGIQRLTSAILKGAGDNYHVVTTAQRDKSFRLFVSKVVTYVSQKTEVDIYVVQMRTKEYGDPLTTRLLKSISVGLRFRFLVLEDQSEFRPEKLGHPIVRASELKANVSEMLGQMDLILREAAEANLSDPGLLILIWGEGQEKKVQTMIDLWAATTARLYAAAEDVLSSTDDTFKVSKEKFVEALVAFCGDIDQMNREFTGRVLSLLADHVKRAMPEPVVSPEPHSTAAR